MVNIDAKAGTHFVNNGQKQVHQLLKVQVRDRSPIHDGRECPPLKAPNPNVSKKKLLIQDNLKNEAVPVL